MSGIKVTVTFEDHISFTSEEAKASNKFLFGRDALVHTEPLNTTPEAALYYAFQNIVTVDQLEAYNDLYPHLYPKEIEKIKEKALKRAEEILEEVLEDNIKKME